MMRRFIQIAAPLLAFVVGCRETTPPPRSGSSAASPTTSRTPPSERPSATEVPEGVTYTIIDKQVVPGIKRSLDIRLNRRVSEDVLRAIAVELKNSDPNSYERTFIGYYLPHMKVNAGSWATTHFNPNLEVRILGLTAEQEAALKGQPDEPSREVVGSWIDDSPFVGSRITILRQSGKLLIEHTYGDGSGGKVQLIEKKSPLGRRFDKVNGSSAGDHWILDSNGDLQLRDKGGLIATAKQIK